MAIAQRALTGIEVATKKYSAATKAATAASEKVKAAFFAEGSSAKEVERAINAKSRATDKATEAAKRHASALRLVHKAEQDVARASSLRQKAGNFLNNRANNWGGGASGYIGPAAATAGAGLSVKNASSFGYQNQLIANTGDMSATERDAMAKAILQLTDSKKTNQMPAELQKALSVYTSAGLDVQKQGLPALEATGKTATAYGIPIEEVAMTVSGAMANLGIKAEEIGGFLDGMSAAGKAGRFEMKNFAEHFGSLSANMAQYGISGMDGAKYIAGAMQAIQVSSKNSAEAATNWENVKNKIFATETADKYMELLDFDLPEFLEEVRKEYKGNVIDAFVKKTKELTGGDIMKVAPAAADAQFRAGLMALMNNQAMTDKANTKWDSSGNVVQKDFDATTATTQEKLNTAKIEATLLAIELGQTLEPAITSLVATLKDILPPIAQWISENPELTAQIAMGAGAIMALNLALGPMISLFKTAGGMIDMAKSALGGLSDAAGPAADAAGTTVGGKLMLGIKGALAGAAMIKAGYELGDVIGNTVGQVISDRMTKSINVALSNGAGVLEGKGFHSLADKIASRRSANLEDRRASYDLMINNPKLKEGIAEKLAEVETTRKELQAKYDALMVQRRAVNNPGAGVALDEQMAPIRGALSQLPAEEARLKSALPIMDLADKFKANDPATLKAALEATQRIEDDKAAKAAGLKSIFGSRKDSDAANTLRDIAITIYGVGEQDPAKLGEVVKEKIKDALGERDSDSYRSDRQSQSDQTSAF